MNFSLGIHLPYGRIVHWILLLLSDKKRRFSPFQKTKEKERNKSKRKFAQRQCMLDVKETLEWPQKRMGNSQKIRHSRERIENKAINCWRNYELRGCWNTKLYSNVIPNAITHIEHKRISVVPINTIWVHVSIPNFFFAPQKLGNRELRALLATQHIAYRSKQIERKQRRRKK